MRRVSAACVALALACGGGWSPPHIPTQSVSTGAGARIATAVERARAGGLEDALGLGDLYYALGYPDAANACYRRAAGVPGALDARLLAGLTDLDTGRREPARRHFESVLEIDPDHKTARLELAHLDLEAGQLGSARKGYASLHADYPDSAHATLGLARTALAAGDGPEAVRWFQRTLELRPNADRLRNALAEAYRLTGRHDLARHEQARAGSGELLSDEPALARVGKLRLELTADTVLSLAADDENSAGEVAGFAVAQLGIVPGAHGDLAARGNQVGQSQTARSRFWFAVGALADRQGDPQAAVSAYRQAVEAVPEHHPSHTRLARSLIKLERFDEAEAALIETGSEEVSVIRDLAWIARRRGDLEASAGILEKAIRGGNGSGSSELILDLAETRQEQGRIAEAMAVYRRITDDADPLIAATAWSRIAAEQQRQSDDTAAAASFARAVEASPDWLAPRYGLAAALGRLGKYDDASKVYREILDLQPSEEQAWLGAATAAVFGEASAEAVRRFLERGLGVLPESRALRSALARHLVVHGGTDSAMAARALQLAEGLVDDETSPADRETLAMALAASRRFEEAVKIQQELLATASQTDRPRLERNLDLYRAGQPCCK